MRDISHYRVDDGFHEVLVIVESLSSAAERLCEALGYQPLWRGASTPGAMRLLGLDSNRVGEEILIGDAAQGRGYFRLIQFPGLLSGVMREGGQPWDTGGIFDINLYSLAPIETMQAALGRAGFCAFAPITAYNFVGLSVKEVVNRDSDGLGIALIERMSPPLTEFADVRNRVSYIFNSTQSVPSREAARALYVDALGWRVAIETEWNHAPSGLNCLGLPLDVARERLVKVGIYHPHGKLHGSVEVLEVAGERLDFSTAAPPDRGIAALRFPVSNVETFLQRAARGGCRVIEADQFHLAPYGDVRGGAAITPWGARLEVFSQ